MRHALWPWLVILTCPVWAADEEKGFIDLLTSDQLSQWSGGGSGWELRTREIRGKSASGSKVIYDGQVFQDYFLRFSAQIVKGSVRILLRNSLFAYSLELDTERVWVRAGAADGFVAFLNKPGEWADYEIRVRRGRFSVLRNGQHSGLDYGGSHMPETGKISLQIPEPSERSEVVIRKLRIQPLN